MTWLVAALAAHLSNALVFIADKSLLGTKGVVGNPARYAALSGLVAAGAAVVLPLGFAAPTPFIIIWSLVAGIAWIVALWLFYVALTAGEPSRVVPLTGSAVPLFTLVFAMLVLGERLSMYQWWGAAALILGGALLSIRLKGAQALPRNVVWVALASGAAFAAHFSVVDVIYDRFPSFWAAFAYTRLGVGVVAFGLLVSLWWTKPTSLKRSRRTKSRRRYAFVIGAVFLGSKLLAAVALLLQNYAISQGSVTLVNALQGTQYVFVLLLAAGVSMWWPHLFREELSRVALWQKGSGIILIGVGVALLVV